MILGEHIMLIRKQKNLSQAALGKAIGTSGDIIGRYERSIITPSIDVVSKIADVLEVSIDFLIGKTSITVDTEVMKRLEDIEQLDPKAREHLIYTIDSLIKAAKLKSL